MLHITRKENMVLNQIKYFQNEYTEGVPYKILKLDLDLSEMDLKDILNTLAGKSIVSYKNDTINLLETGTINVHETKEAVKNEELNQTEERAFEMIKEIAGDEGIISKNLLEGQMMYSELKLTNLKTYNLIISLENKGLIKKSQRSDGEYYSLN